GFDPGDITANVVQPPPTSHALFDGFDTAGHYDLWVTDGTAAGTSQLTGISGAAPGRLFARSPTALNGKVLFAAEDTAQNDGLWVTDGTSAGTSELTGISGTASDGVGFSNAVVFNGEVLFQGRDDQGFHQDGFGLWVTNGTAAGTFELTGISGAPCRFVEASCMTPSNGEVVCR